MSIQRHAPASPFWFSRGIRAAVDALVLAAIWGAMASHGTPARYASARNASPEFAFGVLGLIGLVTLIWHLWEQSQKAAEKAAHETFLRTPEGIAWMKAEAESTARDKWKTHYQSKTMDDVDRMNGREFEQFLERLFSLMGYTNIQSTKVTSDQGGDIVCVSPSKSGVVIQAKRWKGAVGNGAVQELLGAMLYYERAEGMVVTNSKFTAAARELAKKDRRITLCDGAWLAAQIRTFLPPAQQFTWEAFNRLIRPHCQFSEAWMSKEFDAAEAREAIGRKREVERKRQEAERLHQEQERQQQERAAQKNAERKTEPPKEPSNDAERSRKSLRLMLEGRRLKIIQFKYKGGSKPGAMRLVRVESVSDFQIEGFDMEKEKLNQSAFRIYMRDKIEGDIRILDSPSIVVPAIEPAPDEAGLFFQQEQPNRAEPMPAEIRVFREYPV